MAETFTHGMRAARWYHPKAPLASLEIIVVAARTWYRFAMQKMDEFLAKCREALPHWKFSDMDFGRSIVGQSPTKSMILGNYLNGFDVNDPVDTASFIHACRCADL